MTLGQYYPGDSVIHKLDPRTKLLATLLYIIGIFFVDNLIAAAFITLVIGVVIYLSHVPVSFMFRGLKGIVIILLIAAFFNLFMTPGVPLFKFWIFKVTEDGIYNAILMTFRMIYLIVGSSVLTLTTTQNDLTNGLEKGLHFLTYVKVPVADIAMMMSIALRFIPILMEETDKIMKAQMARGASFDTGNIVQKAKSMIPLLVPLFVNSFKRAYDLANAMEARCFDGSENRTKMKPLKYSKIDYIGYLFAFLGLIGCIVLGKIF
jgi:energy-coupling factor transport system permease protein